jgi:hypothetical protein
MVRINNLRAAQRSFVQPCFMMAAVGIKHHRQAVADNLFDVGDMVRPDRNHARLWRGAWKIAPVGNAPKRADGSAENAHGNATAAERGSRAALRMRQDALLNAVLGHCMHKPIMAVQMPMMLLSMDRNGPQKDHGPRQQKRCHPLH